MTCWRQLVVCTLFSLLAACTTPNVKPFADETLQLNTIIVQEHSEIQQKLDYLGNSRSNQAAAIQTKKQDFDKSAEVIESSLSNLVAYANGLVALAGDDTDGEKSIGTIADNLDKISSLLGIAGVDIKIGDVTKTIANWITEIQKQKSLGNAMAIADPVIQEIAKALSDRYTASIETVIKGVDGLMVGTLDDKYPLQAIGFYQEANNQRNNLYADMRTRLANVHPENPKILCPSKANPDCISKDTVDAFRQADALINDTKPIYDGYMADLNAIKSWTQTRTAQMKKISLLAKTWGNEHSRVLGVLRACDSFSKKCETFSPIEWLPADKK